MINKITVSGFISGALFILGLAMLKEHYHGWHGYGIVRPCLDCFIAIGLFVLSMEDYREIKEDK